MPTCDPAAFPPGLHTGYFDVLANHDDLLGAALPADRRRVSSSATPR